MKISLKLIILIESVVLLGILMTSVGAFQIGQRMIAERVDAQLRSVVQLKSNQLDDYLHERASNVNTIVNSEEIRDLLPPEGAGQSSSATEPESSIRAKRARLQKQLDLYDDFTEFLICDPAGEVYLATDADHEGMIKTQNEYFLEGKSGLYVDNLDYDMSQHRPRVMVSAPILDDHGKLQAVLVGEVDLAAMSALMMERSGLEESGETYLVNSYNFALTELRKEVDSRYLRTQAVENSLRDRPTDIPPALEYTDYAGDQVLATYKYLPEREASLIAKVDTQEAYAHRNQLGTVILATAGISAAISLGLAYLFSRTIDRAIQDLAEGARKIGSGALDHRITTIRSQDELGALASAFNSMAQDLKDRKDLLEQRTRELSQRKTDLEQEIEERKRVEEALRKSEERFRSIVEQSSDGIVLTDEQGRIVEWNQAQERITGLLTGDVLGQPFWEVQAQLMSDELRTSAVLENIRVVWQKILATEQVPERMLSNDREIRRADGTRRHVQVNAFPVKVERGFLVGSMALDITERKRAEDALQESEERLGLALEGTGVGLWDWMVQTGETVFNEKWAEIVGHTLEELAPVSIDTWIKLTHPDDLEKSNQLLEKHFAGETDHYICEARMKHKDGHWVWVLDRGKVFEWDEDGKPVRVAGTHLDITERKRAEDALRESEERYRDLFENANDLIQSVTPDGHFVYVNRAWRETLGYDEDDIADLSMFDVIHPDDHDHCMEVFGCVMAGESIDRVEAMFLTKDKRTIIVEGSVNCNFEGGIPAATRAIFRNITGRKRVEEQLRASLREKEMLLRELHHRVKNNMQTIIGLLDMQSRYYPNEGYDVPLREIHQQVHSMALVHERMYQSEDLSQVDFGSYLRDLCRELIRFYGAKVAIRVAAEEVPLGVDKAIPCGLVVNELVSNALQHAFPPGRAGEISVSLRPVDESDGELELVVSDDGVGIQEDLDFRNTGSMGLYLVVNLVERQLGGIIELDRTAGTKFRITFHK